MIVNRTDTIGVFQFEDTVNTSDNGGTNGTVTGTTAYVDTISGKGFDFDGSSRVSIGNSSLSNSSNITALLRMNLDTHTTNDKIFAKRSTANGNGFYLYIASSGGDVIRFRCRNAADSTWVAAELVMPETIPYAIRCEINLGTEITLSYYTIDGAFTTTTTAFTDSTYATNTDNINIGDFESGGQGMDGSIDDFTIIEGLISDEDFYRYYLGMGITDL